MLLLALIDLARMIPEAGASRVIVDLPGILLQSSLTAAIALA
jgi:hypothetical protein